MHRNLYMQQVGVKAKIASNNISHLNIVKKTIIPIKATITPNASGIDFWTAGSALILLTFEKVDDNIFVAGCYNGSGIGVGTLFGEQIAIKASNQNTLEIETIEARNKPTWLPPQPFLNIGIKTRLIYERIKARSEI